MGLQFLTINDHESDQFYYCQVTKLKHKKILIKKYPKKKLNQIKPEFSFLQFVFVFFDFPFVIYRVDS